MTFHSPIRHASSPPFAPCTISKRRAERSASRAKCAHLEIGIRQLGLPVGLVSRLDGDQISLPYVVGGEDDLPEGTVVRACDSFAAKALRDEASW